MGRLTVSGLDELAEDLAALAQLPESVIDDMLTAQADVIEPEQKRTAQAMGVYDTGLTASSIQRTKAKKTKGGRSLDITFKGSRKRNGRTVRNAEIAFVNEYGRRGQAPRPFLQTAIQRKEQEAVEASERVYHAYLDSRNL